MPFTTYDGIILDEGGAATNVKGSGIGAVGNGSNNDAAKFYGLISGHYIVPAGTYRFSTTGTIAAGVALEFMKGAVLKPDAGITITINGLVVADNYAIFDITAGGSIRFQDPVVDRINVKWFGAAGNGSANDTTAIQKAVASVSPTTSPGMFIYFPPGNYLVTDTIDIDMWHAHLAGAKEYVSRITFSPSSAKSLFRFGANSTFVPRMGWNSIRDLHLVGSNTTQKTAVEIIDGQVTVIENVHISLWHGGDASIGLHLKGRDTHTIRKVYIDADRPIVLAENPSTHRPRREPFYPRRGAWPLPLRGHLPPDLERRQGCRPCRFRDQSVEYRV